MSTSNPKPVKDEQRAEIRLEELNARIDKAVERFDKMRRDYRFLAGPNWRDPGGRQSSGR
jgi:hypothetical protein